MAFTLTYSDGQETDYDDDTAWTIDDGVLKMGRQEGEWSVLVSPSHWAVIEVGGKRPHEGEAGNETDEHDSADSESESDADSDSDGEGKDD